jgi:hypothetical protein
LPFDVSDVNTIFYSYDASEIESCKEELRQKIDSVESGNMGWNPISLGELAISIPATISQNDIMSIFTDMQGKIDASFRKMCELEYVAAGDAFQEVHEYGVIAGDPHGNMDLMRSVNRAEFAALITRALWISESELSEYSSKAIVQDISGYGWAVPYLAFCIEKGIFLCDEHGNIKPGEWVTVRDAVYMALRVGFRLLRRRRISASRTEQHCKQHKA